MHVEPCSLALLHYMLPVIDPQRRGVGVDIGVGTFDFYCELFAHLGYPTVAVEPLPTDHLRKVCRRYKISLVESVISDHDGTATLYVGSYGNRENLNLNSLNPDWWGASNESREVRSMTLGTLLEDQAVAAITCMKIDVEGAEETIIAQLEAPLPAVLMFEYGGGATRDSGRGGWTEKYFNSTVQCIRTLQTLGYRYGLRVDSAPGSVEAHLDFQAIAPEATFPPEAHYGNIIVVRDRAFSPEEIAAVCEPYRDNNTTPPSILPRRPGLFNRLFGNR